MIYIKSIIKFNNIFTIKYIMKYLIKWLIKFSKFLNKFNLYWMLIKIIIYEIDNLVKYFHIFEYYIRIEKKVIQIW
jgi:hypothetical protein